jgi:hypothetical protein
MRRIAIGAAVLLLACGGKEPTAPNEPLQLGLDTLVIKPRADSVKVVIIIKPGT